MKALSAKAKKPKLHKSLQLDPPVKTEAIEKVERLPDPCMACLQPLTATLANWSLTSGNLSLEPACQKEEPMRTCLKKASCSALASALTILCSNWKSEESCANGYLADAKVQDCLAKLEQDKNQEERRNKKPQTTCKGLKAVECLDPRIPCTPTIIFLTKLQWESANPACSQSNLLTGNGTLELSGPISELVSFELPEALSRLKREISQEKPSPVSQIKAEDPTSHSSQLQTPPSSFISFSQFKPSQEKPQFSLGHETSQLPTLHQLNHQIKQEDRDQGSSQVSIQGQTNRETPSEVRQSTLLYATQSNRLQPNQEASSGLILPLRIDRKSVV